MQKLLICTLCALLLTACQSTTTKDAGAPVEERNPATDASGATTAGTSTTGVGGTAAGTQRNPLKDPSSPLSKRIVYFEFDSYVVKDEYKPMIEAHGRYLQANRNARMTVQGSTDERGSREYNIALGQRRADALKKLLVLYGATEIQIETVSFGKEKPVREGHDEASWSQNRRDEIVFAGE
jgi:peptidoglycan-associated lipoprotein